MTEVEGSIFNDFTMVHIIYTMTWMSLRGVA